MTTQETQEGLYPVRLDRMMEALRFAEYELTSGLGEAVDNSIEAGAQNIWVFTKTSRSNVGKKTEVINEIAVVDDGHGMDAEVLHKCLVLGEGHRPARVGGPARIGRFGVGLSLGGISLAQRIEVYSRDQASNDFLFTYLDLTEIREHKQTYINLPIVQDPPLNYAALLDKTSGTIVLLQKCDRLQHNTTGDKLVNASQHIAGLAHYLGRTYRKFIDGGVNIWFNGEKVYLHDPLYILGPTKFDAKNPQKPDLKASPVGTSEIIELDVPDTNGQKAKVTIRMSLLPKEWRSKPGMGGSAFAKERSIDENEGISILRADREVLYGSVPYIIGERGQARSEDIDRFWGCEIVFPPELDNYFQVRYIKRGAEPLPMLRDMIRDRISRTVKELRKQIRREMNQSDEALNVQEATFRSAEDMMAEADRTSPKGKRNDTPSAAQAEREAEKFAEQEVYIRPSTAPTIEPSSTAPTLPTAQTLPLFSADENDTVSPDSGPLATTPVLPPAKEDESTNIPPEIVAPSLAELEAARKKERKKEILEKPYSIVPIEYPGNMFFETHHQMGRVVITLNTKHPFYKEVFEPLCGSIEKMSEDSDVNIGADTPQKRKARHAFMLLLLAYGKGETFFGSDEQIEILNSHREQWGISLAAVMRPLSERG
jgi:hypothetical protein